jgi:hypothetical protein
MTEKVRDIVFYKFLESQYEKAIELDRASDIVHIFPKTSQLCQLYAALFRCKGLVMEKGSVIEHNEFSVGIYFHDDYLRRCDPSQVLTWLSPRNVFHSNIKSFLICIGSITPGTGIVDLLHRIYEVITYQNYSTVEGNALNSEACQYVRNNSHRFPLDNRPLRRRKIEVTLEETKKEVKE